MHIHSIPDGAQPSLNTHRSLWTEIPYYFNNGNP